MMTGKAMTRLAAQGIASRTRGASEDGAQEHPPALSPIDWKIQVVQRRQRTWPTRHSATSFVQLREEVEPVHTGRESV